MSGEEAPGVDSRRWTGPEPAPPPLDQRTARAAFLAAGGPDATAPQRAASAVSWAGLMLMLPIVLVGADGDTWLFGMEPLAVRTRAGLQAGLASFLGPGNAKGVAGLVGDPRILAALLTIVGTLVGIGAARRQRAALVRGFTAAEAKVSGGVFTTMRHGDAAPLLLFLMGLNQPGGPWLVGNALALWLVARLAAGNLTSIAERRLAGLGIRSRSPSGWDLATIAVSLGGMLLMLAYALRVFE